MVHALREVWRVLAPDGVLIDLRPFFCSWSVEVVTEKQVLFAGRLDDSGRQYKDLLSNAALAQVQREGWFALEQEASFDYFFYWDTPDEMKAYIHEDWEPRTYLPEEVWAEAQRLVASAGSNTRVRVRENIIISRWRKQLYP